MPRKKKIPEIPGSIESPNLEIRERQELAGIPDSRRFGGSPEADAEFDSRPIMDCHVAGIPVRDLPVTAQRVLHFDQTDEGFLEKNKNRKGIGASVVRDQVDNTLRERAHDLRNRDGDPRQAADPLKFLQRYERPGYRLKLLSARTGSLNPDYEVVRQHNGDPVKYKKMFVGRRKIEDIQADKRAIKQRSAQRMKALSERFRQETEEGAVIPKENVIPA